MLIKGLFSVFVCVLFFVAIAEASEDNRLKLNDENAAVDDFSIYKPDKLKTEIKVGVPIRHNNATDQGAITEQLADSVIKNFKREVKRRYKKRTEINLEILNANSFFHSVDSYYLVSFDYRIIENGQIMLEGNFFQERDCQKIDSLYRGACGVSHVSKILVRKIK